MMLLDVKFALESPDLPDPLSAFMEKAIAG